jgi:PPIC-type PPIASE domain
MQRTWNGYPMILALGLVLSHFPSNHPSLIAQSPVLPSQANPAQANPGTFNQPVYIAEHPPSPPAANNPDVRTASALGSPNNLPANPYADNDGFDRQRAMLSPATSPGELFEASRVIAVVGEERILIGDLFPPARITPEIVQSREFEMQLRKALRMSIQQKCLAQHFLNAQANGKPKKEREEMRAKMMSKTAEIFRTKVLPEQIKKAKCETEAEFIQLLEEQGTSLTALLYSFAEQVWADQALREGVQEKPNVYLDEMQDYYNAHPDDWNRPARVRFRIMSAMFKQHPNREEAYRAIVDMWNQVYFGGAPFEAVAKKLSTGYFASEGGVFDWTRRGSLKSKAIEETVFTINPKALSQIIEDADGFHVIEVLERENDFRMNFAQAQSEIREAILKEKRTNQENEYKKKIQDLTPIWSRWPEDIPGSKDLQEIQ